MRSSWNTIRSHPSRRRKGIYTTRDGLHVWRDGGVERYRVGSPFLGMRVGTERDKETISIQITD